jgi:hypothetical protein
MNDRRVLLVHGLASSFEHNWRATGWRLLAALPDARLVTLRGVDHFGTPSDFGSIDAVTRFLAGSPHRA